MGIAALILALLGTALSAFQLTFFLGIPFSAVALLLAVFAVRSARARQQKRGLPMTALVFSLVGVGLGLFSWYLCARSTNAFVHKLTDPATEKKMNEDFDKLFDKTLQESQKPPPKK